MYAYVYNKMRGGYSKYEPQSAVCYEYLVSKMQRDSLLLACRSRSRDWPMSSGSVVLLRSPTSVGSDGLVVSEPRFGMKERAGIHRDPGAHKKRAGFGDGCGRDLCRKNCDIEISELEVLQKQMAGSVRDRAVWQTAFHKALLNAAKNRYLTMSFEAIHKTLAILFAFQYRAC